MNRSEKTSGTCEKHQNQDRPKENVLEKYGC